MSPPTPANNAWVGPGIDAQNKLLRGSIYRRKSRVLPRETREGWRLQTVETQANGDPWGTYDRGPSLVGSLGSVWQYKRFLSCLSCSSRSSTKYFFLTRHSFKSFVSIAQQAWQAVVPRRLSLNKCRWSFPFLSLHHGFLRICQSHS